jgi:predicted aconitase with swiveling domain
MILHGRTIHPGKASGIALVTSMGISFFGGVDPQNGVIVEKNHELEGKSVKDKILVFPTGKGSTVGSYSIYRLKSLGNAPAGIINSECETITAVGCIIAEIPCIDWIDIKKIKNGDQITLDADKGSVEITAS